MTDVEMDVEGSRAAPPLAPPRASATPSSRLSVSSSRRQTLPDRRPMSNGRQAPLLQNELCYCGEPAEEYNHPGCSHRFHWECFHRYVEHEITDGRLVIFCPGRQENSSRRCARRLSQDTEILPVLRNMPANDADRYRRTVRDAAVVQDPTQRFCPTPDCGGVLAQPLAMRMYQKARMVLRLLLVLVAAAGASAGMIWATGNTSFGVAVAVGAAIGIVVAGVSTTVPAPLHWPIQCEQCQKESCFVCERQDNAPCAVDRLLELWAAANDTRNCPRCHAIIERIEGTCNHMTCRRGCGHEFCWICLQTYTDSSHFEPPSTCTQFGGGNQNLDAVTAAFKHSWLGVIWLPMILVAGAAVAEVFKLPLVGHATWVWASATVAFSWLTAYLPNRDGITGGGPVGFWALGALGGALILYKEVGVKWALVATMVLYLFPISRVFCTRRRGQPSGLCFLTGCQDLIPCSNLPTCFRMTPCCILNVSGMCFFLGYLFGVRLGNQAVAVPLFLASASGPAVSFLICFANMASEDITLNNREWLRWRNVVVAMLVIMILEVSANLPFLPSTKWMGTLAVAAAIITSFFRLPHFGPVLCENFNTRLLLSDSSLLLLAMWTGRLILECYAAAEDAGSEMRTRDALDCTARAAAGAMVAFSISRSLLARCGSQDPEQVLVIQAVCVILAVFAAVWVQQVMKKQDTALHIERMVIAVSAAAVLAGAATFKMNLQIWALKPS